MINPINFAQNGYGIPFKLNPLDGRINDETIIAFFI